MCTHVVLVAKSLLLFLKKIYPLGELWFVLICSYRLFQFELQKSFLSLLSLLLSLLFEPLKEGALCLTLLFTNDVRHSELSFNAHGIIYFFFAKKQSPQRAPQATRKRRKDEGGKKVKMRQVLKPENTKQSKTDLAAQSVFTHVKNAMPNPGVALEVIKEEEEEEEEYEEEFDRNHKKLELAKKVAIIEHKTSRLSSKAVGTKLHQRSIEKKESFTQSPAVTTLAMTSSFKHR